MIRRITNLLKEWVDAAHPRRTGGGSLPEPVCVARAGQAQFFVYRVKRADERHFPNTRELSLLKEARKTYTRYGRVPPIDEYDKKSAIYLARAVYPMRINSRRITAEEWLSVRFIPAAGPPRATEDLLVCRVGGKAILPLLRQQWCGGDPHGIKQFVTLSRLCRIAPAHGKNKYTPQLFALMNRQFVHDMRQEGAPYTMLTALLQPRLIDRALSVAKPRIRPPFVRAEQTLGLEEGERVRIDRTLLSYRYPGYFLRMDELADALARLAEKGKVPRRAVPQRAETFEEQVAAGRLAGNILPTLLMREPALRKEIDRTVGDAVALYLMPLADWEKGIDRMLRQMNIHI